MTDHAERALLTRLRVAVFILAGLVAIGFGVLLWLFLGPFHDATSQRHRLACQVEQLGGKPIGGVRCPPSPTTSPTSHRHGKAAPAPSYIPAPGSSTFVLVPSGTTSASTPAPSRSPRPKPHHHPSSSPRPSPTSTPVVVCATVGPVDGCVHRPFPLPRLEESP